MESVSLTFPIDISYLIHSVGIKWNVGGCKLEKNKNKSDKQIMIFINHIKYYHGHNYTVLFFQVEEQEECMETDNGDVVIQMEATGCDLPVKETIKLPTCEYLTTDENQEARENSDGYYTF